MRPVKPKRIASPRRIAVLLAEDHTVVRQGLRQLLQADGDIEVVGEASTGRQAVALARKLRPAVVVMDITMPLLNGLAATKQILKAVPGTKVLILSAHSDDVYVEQVTALGAAGYLLKQTSADILSQAVRAVQKGNTFFSPSITKRLRSLGKKSLGKPGWLRKKGSRLTSREMEVLQLVAEGKANKETAVELGISVKTVEKHREHLMKKLRIHDTASLTRYAIRSGVIESSVQMAIC